MPTGWVPGKRQKAPGCGVLLLGGGVQAVCQQREEVYRGFLKRDTHFLALAADQLQPAWEAVAAGDGLWGCS